MTPGQALAAALGIDWKKLDSWEQDTLTDHAAAGFALVCKWLRRPNEDGSPCSLEREALARRIEEGEHLK